MKNKKTIYDYFKYTMYRYAPESFKLFFQNIEIPLSYESRSKLSMAALKTNKEFLKVLKAFIRNKTIFKKDINIYKELGIRTDKSENSYITLTNFNQVNIYDIQSKLYIFKAIKKAYNNNRYAITTTTGIMETYGKFTKKEVPETKEKMINRIIYI